MHFYDGCRKFPFHTHCRGVVSVRATDHISYRAKKSGSGSGREWRGPGRAGGGSEFCQTFLYAPGCRGSTSKRGGGGHMFSQILRLQAGKRPAPPGDRSARLP